MVYICVHEVVESYY